MLARTVTSPAPWRSRDVTLLMIASCVKKLLCDVLLVESMIMFRGRSSQRPVAPTSETWGSIIFFYKNVVHLISPLKMPAQDYAEWQKVEQKVIRYSKKIPYRTKFCRTKLPKIWLAAENFVRRKSFSAEILSNKVVKAQKLLRIYDLTLDSC